MYVIRNIYSVTTSYLTVPLLVVLRQLLQCLDGRREEVLTTPLVNPWEVTEFHVVGLFLVRLSEEAHPTLGMVWTVSLADESIDTRAATVKVELPKSGPHSIAAVEDVEDDDETEEEGCGMDAEQMEGMIAALAAQTKKFWKTWRSALVSQA